MKTVALFGAGQIGAMVSRLLGTGYGACCFADNSEEKWGGELAGIPIVSPRDALLLTRMQFASAFWMMSAQPKCAVSLTRSAMTARY